MATVDALLLCDSAARDAQTGKWTLVGVFDAVWAADFPAVHGSMDVYFRLRAAGLVSVQLLCRGPSGAVTVMPPVAVSSPPRGLVEGTVRVAGLELGVPGDYRFELHVDGQLAGTTDLTVAQLPTRSNPIH